VQRQLAGSAGPVVAATDYMRIVPDQIRPFVEGRRFVTLGTDGFGLSDTRQALRTHFEVSRHHIAVAALKALADDGRLRPQEVAQAIALYGIDAQARSPALA
jgi:pyruvate dehydrogenase E1 component